MTNTMAVVLRVLVGLGGSDYWDEIKRVARDRSGRTVRPNRSTLNALVAQNLVTLAPGQHVTLTAAGANWVELNPLRAAQRRGSAADGS